MNTSFPISTSTLSTLLKPEVMDSLQSVLQNGEQALPIPQHLLNALLPKEPVNPDATLEVKPDPGFVIKTHAKQGAKQEVERKLFINLCHSPYIPAPPLVSDEELILALSKNDNSSYKIPLSLSELKVDKDKSGQQCWVIDACVNSRPFDKSVEDVDFKSFLVELCLQWVEAKCQMELRHDVTFPKLFSKGKLSTHVIRRPAKPFISEEKPIPRKKIGKPNYKMMKEPDCDSPDFLVYEIQVPKASSVTNAILEIEKRKLFFSIPDIYLLSLQLPYDVDTLEGGAQFDRNSRVLTVTLQILK